jgi:hypothetical protein
MWVRAKWDRGPAKLDGRRDRFIALGAAVPLKSSMISVNEDLTRAESSVDAVEQLFQLASGDVSPLLLEPTGD